MSASGPRRSRFPSATLLAGAAALLTACLFWACNLGGEKEARHTLSFTSKYDSLKAYDKVVIVVRDPAGAFADTLFNGKVDSKAALQNLTAPHYQGGKVDIVITGFNDGAVAYQVEKKFDGATGITEASVVKVTPDAKLSYGGSPLAGKAGDTATLPAIVVSPAELESKELIWTSSNPEILIVADLRFILKAPGTAEIIATLASDPTKTVRITITVSSKDGKLPPAAPVIASVTPGDGKVVLAWNSVEGAESYNVYYGEGNGVDKGSTRVKSVNAPYVVSGLKNGTTYAFGVTAANSAGESGIGIARTAMPAATAASAPALTGVVGGDGKVTLAWDAVPGASGYLVYYTAGGTVDKTGTKAEVAASPHTVSGLANGTQYAFAVAAVTGSSESPLGNIATATPQSAPAGLAYSANPGLYWLDLAITPNTASYSGKLDSFSIAPALPAGLSLDKSTGAITGKPSAAAAARPYTVTGFGAGGNLTATLALSVNGAPSALRYAPDSGSFQQGKPITALSPTVSGIVDSFSIAPAPPTGLSFSRATGTLSGTPTSISAAAAYTVTARNPAGSAAATLRLAVVSPASGFSYAVNPATYWIGVAIAANAATVNGSVDSFTVSPTLPAGLGLNKATGAITGTPSAAAAAKAYTVTAHNPAGSATAQVNLTVNNKPSALAYAVNPAAYYLAAITANTASVTGVVDSFTVSPALPAGLSLNKSTGAVTGTPTVAAAAANYTVSAHNPAGSAQVNLNITVAGKPSGLAYAGSPFIWWIGKSVGAGIKPVLSGQVDSFTVSPALPAGLAIAKATGQITGSPTTAQAASEYSVSAHNRSGTAAAVITISISGPPTGFSYLRNNLFMYRFVPIIPNPPTVTGVVDSYTVDKALPNGLVLNKATGYLTGTPIAGTAQASYTFTAHNQAGTAAYPITLYVTNSIGTQVKKDNNLDTTTYLHNFGYGSIVHIGSHPVPRFYAMLDFGLNDYAKNGAKDSARILLRTWTGGDWTGAPVTIITRVYRFTSAWAEGTGNHYWHRDAYRNGGETLLKYYEPSGPVKTASTDPADNTGVSNVNDKALVRAPNVVLTDVDTIVVRHGPTSTLKDGILPKPEFLVDMKIKATNYFNSIITGAAVDYGCFITLEGTSDAKSLNFISKEGSLDLAPHILAN